MTIRTRLVLACCLLGHWGCGETPPKPLEPTAMPMRAERRAFYGAPPVIPHKLLGGKCVNCHNADGDKVLPGVGVAPANPHLKTPGMSEESRCLQCHIFQNEEPLFAESEFTPWVVHLKKQDSRQPPAIPHTSFMREDCNACHAGLASRPEIRCNHAERKRCQQCHISPSPFLENPSFISSAKPSEL
ncbi:MAG: hypothetical protein KDA84_12190 [Planctomycetaceae bacterium]|nr:hypothetical protein [Planctomycetaceae bacterium]